MSATFSPKQFAAAIDVSESSVKRWVDSGRLAASKTAGGHRRISFADAIQFIRDTKFHVVRPDVLELPAQMSDTNAPGDAGDLLYRALDAGDSAVAQSVVYNAFVEGESAASIFDGMIRDAMRRIGEKWQHQTDGIFVEHRATDICIHTLNRLRSMLPEPMPGAPVAVGGARPGDPYMIPSLMAAITLADQGFEVVNLGPNTPVDVMLQAVARHQPAIVWVSVAAEVDSRTLVRELSQLNDGLANSDARIAVGGRFADHATADAIERVTYVETMSALAGFARGVVQSPAA